MNQVPKVTHAGTETKSSVRFLVQFKPKGKGGWEDWRVDTSDREFAEHRLKRCRQQDTAGWEYRLVTYERTTTITRTEPTEVDV